MEQESSMVDPPQAPQQAQVSGMAIGSLVCGILAFCTCITGVPALILGPLAISRSNKSEGSLTGKGMAWAGIITGILGMLVHIILSIAMIPAFMSARTAAYQAQEIANVQQILVGMVAYAVDNDGAFPEDVNEAMIYMSSADVFVSPFNTSGMLTIAAPGFALADAEPLYHFGDYWFVRGYTIESNHDAVLVFSRVWENGPDGRSVGFVDGSVRFLTHDEFAHLIEQQNASRAAMHLPPIDTSEIDDMP